MSTDFGPAGNIPLKITSNLASLLRSHTKYVSNLTKFKQYCIWRYTIGSGQITAQLVGFSDPIKTVAWCYQFFKFYPYSINTIPKPFKQFSNYFKNPNSFLKEKNVNLAQAIITLYAGFLQRIIYQAPKTSNPLYVWKISSEYDSLPSKNLADFKPKIVEQKPFNSTTYDPTLNLEPFTNPISDCCLFRILIPKGSHVLYIPDEYHAYPFERELLLPFNSSFDIGKSYKVKLNYIPKSKQQYVKVQDEPYSIGPVFELSQECLQDVISKPITLFDTKFLNRL